MTAEALKECNKRRLAQLARDKGIAGWHAMLHESGAKHPRGGSGMLTQAMARRFESDGGTILLDAPVGRIMVEHGAVRGVELQNGEQYHAPAVVSNAHVQTTLDLYGWVREDEALQAAANWRSYAAAWQVNGER